MEEECDCGSDAAGAKDGWFSGAVSEASEGRGISACCEGLICRSFYEKPDFRISADEDLLLRKEEFETFDRILLEEGYKRQELDPKDLPYEIPYRNPRNQVYIELHFSLFAEGEVHMVI